MLTHDQMLLAVLISHSLAVGQQALKGRVDDELLAYRVARELPSELVPPFRLLLVRLDFLDVVVVLLKLSMVVLDGLAD